MCSRFSERLFEGLCLFVSPLIGCTGSSILHRESSILRCLPHIPLSVLTQHGQRRIRLFPCATTRNTEAPLHAEHAHGFNIQCRDGKWTGPRPHVTLNGCFSPSWFPHYRYCNEHLLCSPHVFWTGWGPWERCTAQCGGGIQARRRTCENGPDCAGCNVVSSPHPQPAV